MDVHVRQGLLDRPANGKVRLAGVAGVDASLHADFSGTPVPCLTRAPHNLVHTKIIGRATQILTHFTLREGAELAAEIADIRVINVAVHNVGDDVAAHTLPQTICRGANGGELVPPRPEESHDRSF